MSPKIVTVSLGRIANITAHLNTKDTSADAPTSVAKGSMRGFPISEPARIVGGIVDNGITQDGAWVVTKEELAAVPLVCPDGIQTGANAKNILFIAGTGCKGNLSFTGGLPDAFALKGYSSCWINPPHYNLGDAQLTGEYVAHSIRSLYYKSGQTQIYVLGHSQGNLNIQWALNFFPSTRRMVASFAALAGDFHGTDEGMLAVFLQQHLVGGSTASIIQQTKTFGKTSNYLKALMKHGNMALVPTTSTYGREDEVIQIVSEATSLGPGGAPFTHVSVQDICPDLFVEHVLIMINRVAFYLALDAFEHKSAANIDRAVQNYPDICMGNFAPGVSEFALLYLLRLLGSMGKVSLLEGAGEPGGRWSLQVKKEPPLVPYAANQP